MKRLLTLSIGALAVAAASAAPAQAVTRDVNQAMSETVIAPPAYPTWNGTYDWPVRFHLSVDTQVVITVRLSSTAPIDTLVAWQRAIEAKWSNRFILSDGQRTYPITVAIQWTDAAGADYRITSDAPIGSDVVTDWSPSDPAGATHEFGHMLGNRDEYFTVDGVDFGYPTATGGVMNYFQGPATARNFSIVESQAALAIGADPTQLAVLPVTPTTPPSAPAVTATPHTSTPVIFGHSSHRQQRASWGTNRTGRDHRRNHIRKSSR